MQHEQNEALRYPIGRFQPPAQIETRQIRDWIAELEALPVRLRDIVSPLSNPQLETPYRPGGWTVRQVVHHLSDSHHNSYLRFKWALTEESPLIKIYDEKAWAELFDSRTGPIGLSLDHLEAIHRKLVYLLNGLDPEQLNRTFIHPEGSVRTTLKENIGRYAWHGNHHFAHIQNLMTRQGW
jgi:hypothetical protein